MRDDCANTGKEIVYRAWYKHFLKGSKESRNKIVIRIIKPYSKAGQTRLHLTFSLFFDLEHKREHLPDDKPSGRVRICSCWRRERDSNPR